jgi:xylulokinase
MGHIIGIDVGSQSVKGILCAPDGQPMRTAAHPCAMVHPASGWSDQDPGEWRRGMAAVVRDLLRTGGLARADVSHVGVACQVDGVVALDAALLPLRPAIIWLDRRATVQADRLLTSMDANAIFRISGLNVDASHMAPKMMWIRDAEPEIFERTHLLASVAAQLLGWLTGCAVQDHANASSSLLYDVVQRDWSPPLLDAAGIDVALLPPIAASHAVIGQLTAAAADELGLTTTCAVVTGTGDDHGACLGAGVVGPGLIADVTGTAEPVAAVASNPVFDAEHLVETHAHAVDGSLLVENPGFVSGGSTLWLGQLFQAAAQGDVFDWAAAAPAGADGVLFLPALSGSTAPRWNGRMRGAFSGLSMNHDRGHLARATLEGCVYALRDIVDRLAAMGLGAHEIRVVGGGGRSPLWMQMKADVTGRTVRSVLNPEPTALGAAMLAGIGAGVFRDAQEAADRVVHLSTESHAPDPAVAEVYEDAYARYRLLFDAVESATA